MLQSHLTSRPTTHSQRLQATFHSAVTRGQAWTVTGATITESLSAPYQIQLDLAHEDIRVEGDGLLGQPVELVLQRDTATDRFAGIVTHVQQGSHGEQRSLLQLTIEPALLALRHRRTSRIFQDLSLPAIIEQVLTEGLAPFARSVRAELSDSYAPRQYTVQYEESDFDFVHRLMADAGIVYHFDHATGVEELVLTDAPQARPRLTRDAGDLIEYRRLAGTGTDTLPEAIVNLEAQARLAATAVATRHFDWSRPSAPVEQCGSAAGAGPELESFFFENAANLAPFGAADNTGRQRQVQLERLRAGAEGASGASTVAGLRPGYRFALNGHPRVTLNQDYALVSVTHRYRSHLEASDARGDYLNEFVCIPAQAAWRASAAAARPRIVGVQTATVVGPAGEEIHTDAFGRVKVQFHWDREASGDEHSSCWIRVMQAMGGSGWGFTFIPRVGMEVVVTFVNGDPDQPIVTGSVFNGANPPALNLPAEKTRTTIRSCSTHSTGGFNELRFEDSAGDEEIYLHGERDWNTEIKNDLTRQVGQDERQRVVRDRQRDVGRDEAISVGQNLHREVAAMETLLVGASRSRAVGMNEQIMVGLTRNKVVGVDESVQIGHDANRTVGNDLNEQVGANASQRVTNNAHLEVGGNRSITVGENQDLGVANLRRTAIGTDDELCVGGSRQIEIGGHRRETVAGTNTRNVSGQEDLAVEGSRTRTVAGDEAVTINGTQTISASMPRTLSAPMQTTNIAGPHAVQSGAHSLSVATEHTVNVGGNSTWTIGGDHTVEVEGTFTLKCGDASITINPEGDIVIDTPGSIALQSADAVAVEGAAGVDIKSESDVVVQGSRILLN